MFKILAALFLSSLALGAGASSSQSKGAEPPVKKTASGICHVSDTSLYRRVKHFTAYDTLKACIDSGGKIPAKKTKG